MNDLTHLKTLDEMLSAPDAWQKMEPSARREVAHFVRDAFMEGVERTLSEEELGDLRRVVSKLSPEFDVKVGGLTVSYFPNSKQKLLRFVDLSSLAPEVQELFGKPSAQVPELSAVFVDAVELDYRTFENIIALDRLTPEGDLQIDFTQHEARREDIHTFEIEPGVSARAFLGELDALDLYVRPLETNARGGLRYLFHSAELSRALGEAVRAALPEELLDGFSHVNPVFRCNRFAPEDAPFDAHVDAPYFDPNRGHVSRHTLILYLSEGEGEEVLAVDGEVFSGFDAMTAVVFHQSLEHAGAPFKEGDKVFVRTELVYEYGEEEVTHDPNIAALFSSACYMDRQSLLHPELSGYMQRCYDRVSRAHWEGLSEDEGARMYLRKRYKGVEFLSNGFDFWFRDDVDLKGCAAIAVLDYLNGMSEATSRTFNEECESSAIEAPGPESDWIVSLLHEREATSPAGLGAFPKERLLQHDYPGGASDCITYEITDWGDGECGPLPRSTRVTLSDAMSDSSVRRAMKAAYSAWRETITQAPYLFMGQSVFMDPERFAIRGDKIFIGSEEPLGELNFAADVTNYHFSKPGNFIEVAAEFDAPSLLLPPILWRHHEGCFHLQLDLFRNDWMVQLDEQAVLLPAARGMVCPEAELSKSDMPYLNAAKEHMEREKWGSLSYKFSRAY